MATKIITSNGSGRPVNPFIKFIGDPDNFQKFNEFEEKIVDIPTFLNNQPFMEDYEGEAELVWQYYDSHNEEWDFCDDSYNSTLAEYVGQKTRQAWRILPPSQPVNLASGEQREFKGDRHYQWGLKKKELEKKFPIEFIKMLEQGEPYAHRVFDGLLHGENEYVLLTHLCRAIKESYDNLNKIIQHSPPAPILMEKEQYARFKTQQDEQ